MPNSISPFIAPAQNSRQIYLKCSDIRTFYSTRFQFSILILFKLTINTNKEHSNFLRQIYLNLINRMSKVGFIILQIY